MKILTKETAVLFPIAVLWVCRSFIELEGLFFKDKSKHFLHEFCRNQRVIFVKVVHTLSMYVC